MDLTGDTPEGGKKQKTTREPLSSEDEFQPDSNSDEGESSLEYDSSEDSGGSVFDPNDEDSESSEKPDLGKKKKRRKVSYCVEFV